MGVDAITNLKKYYNLQVNIILSFQIFRLSGIYSNQYNILKRLRLGEAKIINKKNHFFSRVHVEDIANGMIKFFKKF